MNTNSQLAARSALDPSIPQLSNSSKDELKTHFITREGIYKQMTLSEYSRPNKVPLNQVSFRFLTVFCPHYQGSGFQHPVKTLENK